MLGITIFARGRISTVWPVPHYAGTAGAILVAQKRNYTKLISCLPLDVYIREAVFCGPLQTGTGGWCNMITMTTETFPLFLGPPRQHPLLLRQHDRLGAQEVPPQDPRRHLRCGRRAGTILIHVVNFAKLW